MTGITTTGERKLLVMSGRAHPELAEEIHRGLGRRWNAFFDDGGSIGRRYRRQDEAGTPFCVTVDGESVTGRTVTVRDRDSMEQVRVGVDRLEGSQLHDLEVARHRRQRGRGAPHDDLVVVDHGDADPVGRRGHGAAT